MIQFVKGNFFDYHADIRINTVNCVGTMGAGVALQFKNKYPDMNKEYVKACHDGKIQIGKPHVWTNIDFFNDDEDVIVINFPTKIHWKNPSEYEYVEKGLKWLSNFLTNHKDKTITIPALGCGHGGLDWDIVKSMIVKYLTEIEMNILVFEPESSIRNNNSQIQDELLNNHITRLDPNSENYPSKLKGRSSLEIYIRGDLNLLSKKLFSLFVNSKPNEKEKNVIFECLNNKELTKFTFLLGFNSSFEIDIVKHLLAQKVPVIIVLPYSILNLKVRKDLLEYWDDNLVTILSISGPENKWNIADSVKALKFRLKFSDILLFTYHDLNTIRKFEKDIVENSNCKFFINYWNESVSFYDSIEAKKIGKDRETKKPNLKAILELNKFYL